MSLLLSFLWCIRGLNSEFQYLAQKHTDISVGGWIEAQVRLTSKPSEVHFVKPFFFLVNIMYAQTRVEESQNISFSGDHKAKI